MHCLLSVWNRGGLIEESHIMTSKFYKVELGKNSFENQNDRVMMTQVSGMIHRSLVIMKEFENACTYVVVMIYTFI